MVTRRRVRGVGIDNFPLILVADPWIHFGGVLAFILGECTVTDPISDHSLMY